MIRRSFILFLAVAAFAAQPQWWMDEPMRLIQTNLRETDTALDPERLVKQLVEFRANTLLLGMGGIVAHYPAKVEFHYPSKHLPAGRDMFGEVLKLAHARGIRVIGRFDLSKTERRVWQARPEWFFRRANGDPVVYNGLYSACINGGYYREQARKILTEALERYDVDGLFFNMFGNPSTDYSGNQIGHCHCNACRKKFRAKYGRPLPERPDAQYREFMEASRLEVASDIAGLVKSKRPRAGLFTYVQQHVDGIMSEANTAVNRALPMWPYSASDNVNRARNSEPGKMSVNLCMSFVDFPWRFVTVPQPEIRLRLHQALAHGGAVALNMHGTMDQQDTSALEAARPIFEWASRHPDLHAGQQSAARVLLLGGSRGQSYRGFFRLLSEEHIPFAVSDNLAWMEDSSRRFDLVVAPDGVPAKLESYVSSGGRLLVAGATAPGFGVPKTVKRWTGTQGYFRIQDRGLFPSLKGTRLVMVDGDYLELEANAKPLLTLIPPSMFGPPEKVHVDAVETTRPGLVLADVGKGRLAYLPWDIGNFYYRSSSEGHRGLVADLIDHLVSSGRQLKTNAHPLVEMTLMRQPSRGRTLVHLVNLSGHSQTAYFTPIEMRDIRVELDGAFRSARSAVLETTIPVRQEGRYSVLALPRLAEYDVLILE